MAACSLRVERCGPDFAETTVVVGGPLSERKGVNVPDVVLPLSAMTEKDRRDLEFGLTLGIDWLALSFVQRVEDIREVRKIVGDRIGIVAKLEKPAAIGSLDAIVDEADAVMVARGDLGVEMPAEQVPAIQKRIVRACRKAGKPVIVATQMLESMVTAPVPTRAEASDVATAIYDGADAVMLSAESASGKYPVEAVRTMDLIIAQTESDPYYREVIAASHAAPRANTSDAIGYAMRHVTGLLNAVATVAYTSSGYSALRMARERPGAPIIGMTPRRHGAPPGAGLGRASGPVQGSGRCARSQRAGMRDRARRRASAKRARRSSFPRACRSARPARPTFCASRRSSEASTWHAFKTSRASSCSIPEAIRPSRRRSRSTMVARVRYCAVRRIDRRARGAGIARRRQVAIWR